MLLFILVFFLIYSGMHAHAFLRARAALQFGAPGAVLLGALMVCMIAAPFLVRAAERAGHDLLARGIAYVGFLWLGWIFLFFSYSLALDCVRLVSGLFGIPFNGSSGPGQARIAFFIPLVASLATAVYGYWEAATIRTEHIEIRTSKLPPGTGKLRVVQISDVHIGLIVRETRLKAILEKVSAAAPDLFVSTGDLVDGEICDLNHLSDLFRSVSPRLGKVAVTGNHEFYAGITNAQCFTENAGFTLLRGQKREIGGITIVGVDDPAAYRNREQAQSGEADLLSGIPRENYALLLKHRPSVDKAAKRTADLQLSGHVHKGQIFPFSILTWLYYPVQSGLAEVGPGAWLYVSRGSGTWGPPIRFLSPPEVTIVDLLEDTGPGVRQ